MLDRQLDAMMKQAQAAGLPDLCDLPPGPCRGLYREILAAADMPPANVVVDNRRIAAPGGTATIGLRIYTPRADAATASRAVVVYYHGGGYVLGDLGRLRPRRAPALPRQRCGGRVGGLSARARAPVSRGCRRFVGCAAWVCRPCARTRRRPDAPGRGRRQRRCRARHGDGRCWHATATGRASGFQALVYPPAAGGHAGDYASRTLHAAGAATLTLRTGWATSTPTTSASAGKVERLPRCAAAGRRAWPVCRQRS